MGSPFIAPPTYWACIPLVMSFTLHHGGLYLSLEGQPSCLSDSWGLETWRRQRARAAETGSPATLMCWEKQCKDHAERQKGSEWKKGEERERERLKDRTRCTKGERESQKRDSERKMPMGKTGAVLPAPSSSCQRQGWRCHSASALCSIHSSRSF